MKGMEDKYGVGVLEPKRSELSRSDTKYKPMLFDDFAVDASYQVPNELLNDLETNLALVFL